MIVFLPIKKRITVTWIVVVSDELGHPWYFAALSLSSSFDLSLSLYFAFVHSVTRFINHRSCRCGLMWHWKKALCCIPHSHYCLKRNLLKMLHCIAILVTLKNIFSWDSLTQGARRRRHRGGRPGIQHFSQIVHLFREMASFCKSFR